MTARRLHENEQKTSRNDGNGATMAERKIGDGDPTNEELLAIWKRKKGSFGRLRLLKSGNFQASFIGPDGGLHKAPHTFPFDYDSALAEYRVNQKLADKAEPERGAGTNFAQNWLDDRKREIDLAALTGQQWISPEQEKITNETTVEKLIDDWLSGSTAITKESTRKKHKQYMDLRVLCDSRPGFDSLKDELVAEIDRNRIKLWWKQINTVWPDTGNTNAFAYKRLHTAFNYAVNELEAIEVNPVKIAGAAKTPRSQKADLPVISHDEASALVENASERMKAPISVLLWCGLRIGELLELRRKDFKVEKDVRTKKVTVTIQVRRNAQRLHVEEKKKSAMVTMDTPKTDAGNRDVVIPRSVAKVVLEHLDKFTDKGPDAFFVVTTKGTRMLDTSFRNSFNRAKKAAGRPDISPHDCRRYFGTMLVNSGVPLEEGRRIMGHETVKQMMAYQRAASGYQAAAADALDRLLSGGQ